jgi:hypothetical protein
MNTRTKNQGVELPKRYFTYNLEFTLKDIASVGPLAPAREKEKNYG